MRVIFFTTLTAISSIPGCPVDVAIASSTPASRIAFPRGRQVNVGKFPFRACLKSLLPVFHLVICLTPSQAFPLLTISPGRVHRALRKAHGMLSNNWISLSGPLNW